jgi:F-type H+-transporting ATPase subunit b
MLSRFAFRAGAFSPILAAELRQGGTIWLRCASTSVAKPTTSSPPPPATTSSSSNTLENWDQAHKIYFGPERDLVNFPIRKQPLTTPPVRLGFIPESFFQLFYEKTGVSGPYVFGGGLLTFLLSKEIWIVEHGFTHFIAFWLAFYIIAKKYGKGIGSYLDKITDGIEERTWTKPLSDTKKNAQNIIDELEKSIWREEGQKYLFESKKENVDLQLESVYRQRLAEVHQSVKKRLDYQVDVESAQRRLQQQHMVQWIVDGVVKGISPQQEKDSLAKCIQDLKSLAAKHAVA